MFSARTFLRLVIVSQFVSEYHAPFLSISFVRHSFGTLYFCIPYNQCTGRDAQVNGQYWEIGQNRIDLVGMIKSHSRNIHSDFFNNK